MRPTPMLSFAVRHFGCKSGVMITASHNPKEYNGYKAYWEDGAQVVAPHDTNIIKEVQKITSFEQVNWNKQDQLLHYIEEDFDEIYLAKVKELSDHKESQAKEMLQMQKLSKSECDNRIKAVQTSMETSLKTATAS